MSSLASEVAVANLALVGLGADTIMALDEANENARKVSAIFELMRDEVLRTHPWNFAIQRFEFARLATDPSYEYDAQFEVPGDVLRILETEMSDTDFVVEGNKVLANESSFKCRCITRVVDPTQWDENFVTAFAARLEAELAYSIVDNASLAKAKYEIYLEKIRQAKGVDAQEGTPRELIADEWLNSRLQSSTYPMAG